MQYHLLRSYCSLIEIKGKVTISVFLLGCIATNDIPIQCIETNRSQMLIGIEILILLNRTDLEYRIRLGYRQFGTEIQIIRTHLELEGTRLCIIDSREDNVSTEVFSARMHHQRTIRRTYTLQRVVIRSIIGAAMRIIHIRLRFRANGIASGYQRRVEVVVITLRVRTTLPQFGLFEAESIAVSEVELGTELNRTTHPRTYRSLVTHGPRKDIIGGCRSKPSKHDMCRIECHLRRRIQIASNITGIVILGFRKDYHLPLRIILLIRRKT